MSTTNPGTTVLRSAYQKSVAAYWNDNQQDKVNLVLGSQGGMLPFVLLSVVVFWLTVTFASFGLYAQQNASVIAVLFVSALSVAAAIFLLIELDGPFEGVIKISSAPFEYALTQLGK